MQGQTNLRSGKSKGGGGERVADVSSYFLGERDRKAKALPGLNRFFRGTGKTSGNIHPGSSREQGPRGGERRYTGESFWLGIRSHEKKEGREPWEGIGMLSVWWGDSCLHTSCRREGYDRPKE